MLSSLTSGVTGLENFQQQMNVIGNNIANVNTYGFKAATVQFADSFSNTLRSPSSSSATTSGSDTVQVGTGVTITSIANNWGQGSLTTTGQQNHLAISGNGFFQVKDSVSGAVYATRVGAFSVDPNGYLVTSTGERVQGYTDTTLATIGDIKIDATGAPSTSSTASYVGFSVDGQGKINVKLSDGNSFVRGEVLLQSYNDPGKLVSEGDNLFSNLTGAGPQTTTAAAPKTNGLGNIQSGALELSNVDLSSEMATLITAQRAFEANSKIITTSDEVLQIINHLKQ
jgi:flagellar hook protein FlgE